MLCFSLICCTRPGYCYHETSSHYPGSGASLAESFHYTFFHKVDREMVSPQNVEICESIVTALRLLEN